MIRLPPSTILLGRRDLRDYEKRQRTRGREKRQETDKISQRLSCFAVGSSHNDPHLGQAHKDQLSKAASQKADVRPACVLPPAFQDTSLIDNDKSLPPSLDEEISVTESQEDEHGYITVGLDQSPENPIHDTPRPASPSKDDFYYGGFVETPSLGVIGDPHSPFTPNDASTPQQLQLPSSNRLRGRPQLPRSPLFLSQNASSSPERRPTSGLTPRVTSRVATHNTPGIIFAQPPRRPPRTSGTIFRSFRHQTNSFSFDYSERSSAAYEQERTFSNSTDGGARSSNDVSLHEDLRGSSLQSSRNTSAESSNLRGHYDAPDDYESAGILLDAVEDRGRQFIFSSPQLPLPPPFSTVSRSASRADSLPSSPAHDHIAGNPPTSPIRSPSTTPVGSGVEGRNAILHSSSAAAEQLEVSESSPLSASRFNPVNIVSRAINNFRTRSPFSHQGSPMPLSPSTSPTPLQGQSREFSGEGDPVTPSQGYQVYNDALSPELQPQTPAHLPEARHQSRYHPSYTAPVTRAAARRGVPIEFDGESQQTLPRQRHVPIYTPLRPGRSVSPLGLTQSGFQGLYGGRENGDEEQSWVEGVRFNNAETRLWGSRDAQNSSGSLRETPEPDEWRVGSRN